MVQIVYVQLQSALGQLEACQAVEVLGPASQTKRGKHCAESWVAVTQTWVYRLQQAPAAYLNMVNLFRLWKLGSGVAGAGAKPSVMAPGGGENAFGAVLDNGLPP